MTMPVPAPPIPLDCNTIILRAGTVVYRIHDQQFGATEFNPGTGSSRFAPLVFGGRPVPTAYAATSFACAAFETIFHDVDAAAPFKSVYWSAIERLVYSTLTLGRDVAVVPLFTADLLRLGIERRQLIDTPGSTYPQTRLWSAAIHDAIGAPAGIIWVSRRYDEERALMLFGDRVSPGDLVPQISVQVASDADCLEILHMLSQRTYIDIIR